MAALLSFMFSIFLKKNDIQSFANIKKVGKMAKVLYLMSPS